jgi:hypothetical protein
MWHLISFAENESWTTIYFRKFNRRRQITAYKAIYYNAKKPQLTHVGMEARRKGDPKLIEVAEAVIAYMQLMHLGPSDYKQFKFRVRNI